MKLRSILATDCGSTTTKAILIEYINGEYRLSFRGEAPTTVEAPFEDVTRGVLNATMEVEELSGRKLIDGENIITPQKDNSGVDIYISTSSAGGGLQMMVAGVVKSSPPLFFSVQFITLKERYPVLYKLNILDSDDYLDYIIQKKTLAGETLENQTVS